MQPQFSCSVALLGSWIGATGARQLSLTAVFGMGTGANVWGMLGGAGTWLHGRRWGSVPRSDCVQMFTYLWAIDHSAYSDLACISVSGPLLLSQSLSHDLADSLAQRNQMLAAEKRRASPGTEVVNWLVLWEIWFWRR